MMAVHPAQLQEEQEKDEEAGAAEDPVEELIRLMVQTLLHEEGFQVCSDMLEYQKKSLMSNPCSLSAISWSPGFRKGKRPDLFTVLCQKLSLQIEHFHE